MHTLDPVRTSATRVADGLGRAHAGRGTQRRPLGHTAEVADLATEEFDPRFTAADLAAMQRRRHSTPTTCAANSNEVERADAVVLVYPVYWWGMPGLLKGWIDRVLNYGWAYGDDAAPGDALTRRDDPPAGHLAGTDPGTYERHGYAESMRIGIEHGIFEYCGTHVASSHFLFDTEVDAPIPLADTVAAVAADVLAAHQARREM